MFYNPPTTEVFYKTESYTLNEGDHGNVVTFNSAVNVVCSIPKGLRIGFFGTIVQEGAGKVTFAALGPGNQINNGAAGVETKGSFRWAKVLCIDEGKYTVDYGAGGGGGTPGPFILTSQYGTEFTAAVNEELDETLNTPNGQGSITITKI